MSRSNTIGQIHEDDVLGRQREVVHHRQRRNVQRAVDRQLAVGVGAVIGDVRREDVAVAEEVQFAGRRADLRVRGHRVGQLAAEVVGAQRLQIVGDLVRQRRFDQRERLARVVDHVRVGDAGSAGCGCRRRCRAGSSSSKLSVRTQRLRYQAARPPSTRMPWIIPSPLNQCSGRDPRVRSVTQVPAVEFGWDRAFDGQVELGQLVGDRRVVVAHKEVVGAEEWLRRWKWSRS